MENKSLIAKIKNLMTVYGFLSENEPQFNSFKLTDEMIVQVIGEIEVDKEIFGINEETGEREVLTNGIYQNETIRFEVVDGKIISVNQRFTDVKTVEGVILKVDGEVAVGNAVMVVTEEGEIPAPDGEYELEDGTVFKVTDGLISTIGKEDETPAPEETPEQTPEETPNEMDEIFEMLKTFIDSVTEKMNAMSEQMTATSQKLEDVTNEFNNFKKEPAGTKIPNGKVEMSVEEPKNNKLETILRLKK
jgi:hypothetical protein